MSGYQEHTPDYQGYDEFEAFVTRAAKEGVREIVLSARGDTRPKRVTSTSWVAQPVVEIRCTIDALARTESDPLATTPIVWAVRQEVHTGAEEQGAVDRVAKALRARGFSVASASSWAY